LKGVAIQVWHPWFGVEASLLESQVAEFNQTNEWGITVRATSQNSYTELYSSVTAALPGEQEPDVVIALPEYAVGWDAASSVVDLTDYVDDATYGLTGTEVSDFPAAFWAQDAVGGKRLGVPAERGASFLIYDSTWAKDLGYAATPSTSSEFRRQACGAHQTTVTDADKANDAQGGWLINTQAMTFLSWMMAFGGGVLEGDGYHFLTPKNLAGLTFVKQVYDEGCAWTLPPAGDATAAFAAREAMFATANLEQLPDYARAMAAANNADSWTVLSFPGPDQAGLVIYGSSYVVLKSTAERQLASWLFVRWMLSAENQKKWVEATGLFPLRTSVLASLGDYQKSHPQWSAAIDLIPTAQNQPQLASWRQVRVMVGDGFDAMFRSNTPSGRVAEILAIMERAASDLSK
jgi:ABC-type glycerol-3-phosphate transport system substrate-binding protein